MTRQEVITKLLDTYSKYGVTEELLQSLWQSGKKEKFSNKMIYTGLRLAFGYEYGVEERFTLEDVAVLFNCSIDEAEQCCKTLLGNDCGNSPNITPLFFGEPRERKQTVNFMSLSNCLKQ